MEHFRDRTHSEAEVRATHVTLFNLTGEKQKLVFCDMAILKVPKDPYIKFCMDFWKTTGRYKEEDEINPPTGTFSIRKLRDGTSRARLLQHSTEENLLVLLKGYRTVSAGSLADVVVLYLRKFRLFEHLDTLREDVTQAVISRLTPKIIHYKVRVPQLGRGPTFQNPEQRQFYIWRLSLPLCIDCCLCDGITCEEVEYEDVPDDELFADGRRIALAQILPLA